jgi:hypothetical protein
MPPSSVAPGAVVATADEHHAEHLGAGDLVQVAPIVAPARAGRVDRQPEGRRQAHHERLRTVPTAHHSAMSNGLRS